MFILHEFAVALDVGVQLDQRLYFHKCGKHGRLYAVGISDPVVDSESHAKWMELLPRLRRVMPAYEYEELTTALTAAKLQGWESSAIELKLV